MSTRDAIAAKYGRGPKKPDLESTGNPAIIGEELFAQAESKCVSVKGFWGTLTGKGEALEEAESLYVQAANKFKMAQQWDRAGLSFANAAKMASRLKRPQMQAMYLGDAALSYKKVNPEEALKLWQTSGDLLVDTAKFARAAKTFQAMGELRESINDDAAAGQSFARAAEYFKEDGNSEASATKCLLKVADHEAMGKNYAKAIEIYEEVGLTRADHHLLRWGAKDIFFKSALIHLCVDVVTARAAIDRYEDQHPAFGGCRENLLLKSLVDAAEENDVEAFSAAVAKFEQITRLDRWTMTHVWNIKSKLMEDEMDLK